MAQARAKRAGEGKPLSARVPITRAEVEKLIASLVDLDRPQLLLQWRNHLGGSAPAQLPTWLLTRLLAYRIQARLFGDIETATLAMLRKLSGDDGATTLVPFVRRAGATRAGEELRPGALLAREWRGRLERVTVLEDGFGWNGKRFSSLSRVAKAITGTSWNGHRFFALKSGRGGMKTATRC